MTKMVNIRTRSQADLEIEDLYYKLCIIDPRLAKLERFCDEFVRKIGVLCEDEPLDARETKALAKIVRLKLDINNGNIR